MGREIFGAMDGVLTSGFGEVGKSAGQVGDNVFLIPGPWEFHCDKKRIVWGNKIFKSYQRASNSL